MKKIGAITSSLDPLQKLLGNDLVRVDVDPVERGHQPLHDSDDGAADYLKRVQAHVEIREQISWVVADRATGTDLGVITLRFFDVDNQPCWELGYWFAPSAWGRGVATEAAFHVLTFAFRFMEVETVTSGVFLDNPASRRVLEKVGFEGWTQDSIDTAHSGRQPHLATRMTRTEFEEFLFSGGCTAQPQLERSVPVVWVAAAALFDATDRVLVAQRPVGKSLAGLWEFPGGKIEALESPETALILLVSCFAAGIYGGSFSAILLRTPGTSASAASAIEGYEMTRRGNAIHAIRISTFASVIGGIISGFVLLLLAPPLAQVSLWFGPAEYFLVAILGLTAIASVSSPRAAAALARPALLMAMQPGAPSRSAMAIASS